MFLRAVAAFGFVVMLLGCDSSSVPTAGSAIPVPAQISLTPLDGHVNRGDSLEMHARVLTNEAVEIADAVIEWSSSDPGVATVNSNGVAHGLRAGTTAIKARIGKVSAQVPLVVADPFREVPAFLSLDVPRVMLPSEAAQLIGRVYNRFGDQLVGALVTWTSSDTTIALTTAGGKLRAMRPGTAVMRARSDAVTDSVSLVVATPLPARVDGPRVFVPASQGRMRAVQPSPHGATSPFSRVIWSSSDAAVATVDQLGVVSAHSQGTATIAALTDSGLVSVPITIRPLPGRVVYARANRIMSLALDGHDATEIAIEGNPFSTNPALSFDGRALAFECADACRVSLDSATLVPLRVGPGSQPSLSADGSAMLVRIDLLKFALYRRSGGPPVQLSPGFYAGRPQLAPDGGRVLFECSYTDPYEDYADLCFIEENGGTSVFRTSALRPAWAPDALSVAYDGVFGVCLGPIDRVDCTWVNGYAEAGDRKPATPAWSPDGKHLVIATGEELWLVDKDGDNLVRLLKSIAPGGTIASPSWGAWAGVHP